MGFAQFAQSLWTRFSWHGSSTMKQGESVDGTQLPAIERTVPGERRIETTVDCYVTGQYISSKGRLFEIKQRYSVRVVYSTSTFLDVMQELRAVLVSEFEKKYSGYDFNVTDIFVPALTAPREPEAEEEYRGRRLWKLLTRVQRRDFELSAAQEVYRARRRGIIRRYSIRRDSR